MPKVIGRITYNYLFKFLTSNTILVSTQYGFCARHSTVDAAAEFVNEYGLSK